MYSMYGGNMPKMLKSTAGKYKWEEVWIAVEQQQPRPTYWKGRSFILRSTCLLYGQYKEMCGLLEGMGYLPRTEYPLPKKWQRDLGIQPKKSLTDTAWKNKLKGIAQALFPEQKVTLKTADAFLIAYWLRCVKTGCKPSIPQEALG